MYLEYDYIYPTAKKISKTQIFWMIGVYRRLLETLSSSEAKKLKISKAVWYKAIYFFISALLNTSLFSLENNDKGTNNLLDPYSHIPQYSNIIELPTGVEISPISVKGYLELEDKEKWNLRWPENVVNFLKKEKQIARAFYFIIMELSQNVLKHGFPPLMCGSTTKVTWDSI